MQAISKIKKHKWVMLVKTLQLILTMGLGLAISAQAQRAQEVLQLTGGARTKAVWIRQKVGEYNWLYNNDPNSVLMTFDTDEDSLEVFDADKTTHLMPIISRCGEWVVWFDWDKKQTWVASWDGSSKHVLCDFFVAHFGWDQDTGIQWAYVFEELHHKSDSRYLQSRTVHRYPFKDGQLEMTGREHFFTYFDPDDTSADSSESKCRYPFSVSKDAKYMASEWRGGAGVIRVSDGHFISQKLSGWACWVSIAPSLSYRMFHLDNDHRNLAMFDTIGAQGEWIRQVNTTMPDNTNYDICGPRFTNSESFITCAYPLTTRDFGVFCLGRFNTDFRGLSWVALTDPADRQYRNVVGDAWLENGEVPGNSAAKISRKMLQTLPKATIKICRHTTVLKIDVRPSSYATASLLNAAGSVVEFKRCDHNGPISLTVPGHAAGILFLCVKSKQGTWQRKIILNR